MKTILDFLKNPAGSGSGQVSSRYSIIQNLNDRYQRMLEAKKTFNIGVYRSKNSTIFYIRVPSESLPPKSIWYDVFIEIASTEDQLSKSAFYNCQAKVWSNIPAFVYTYAYAAAKQEDIIIWPWIKPYLPKKVFTNAPEIRNPETIMGFEKSIYFALLNILETEVYTLKSVNIKDWKLELPYIKKNIQTFSAIMTKYKLWQEKLAQKERQRKKQEKANRESDNQEKANRESDNAVSSPKALDGKQHKVKTVKKVKKVKKV